MGALVSLFRKPPSEDYETILASLSVSISNRQTRLTELALRERRAALWAAIYSLAGWAVYTFIWYLSLLPQLFPQRTRSNIEIERVAYLGPVIIGPIVALFLRRIVQFWYRRKGEVEEATLKKLLTEQRKTIDDIKQKTNYYNTRSLLERYDNAKPLVVPETPSRGSPSQLRQRPRASGFPQPSTPRRPEARPQTPATPPNQQQSPHIAEIAATPPAQLHRQWFDKVADALLGVDDASPAVLDPARSRYALICAKCSSHNGLTLESLWEDTQYICPKCGHFNPAPRSVRNGTNLSPNVRGPLRRLSGVFEDPSGQSLGPNPDATPQSPKASPSSPRTGSKAIPVDPHPDEPLDPDPEDEKPEGKASMMEVDQ